MASSGSTYLRADEVRRLINVIDDIFGDDDDMGSSGVASRLE